MDTFDISLMELSDIQESARAFLETDSDKNVHFYEKYGLKVVCERPGICDICVIKGFKGQKESLNNRAPWNGQ